MTPRLQRYEEFVRAIAPYLPKWVNWITVNSAGCIQVWKNCPKRSGLQFVPEYPKHIMWERAVYVITSPAVESPTFSTLRRIKCAGTRKARVEVV